MAKLSAVVKDALSRRHELIDLSRNLRKCVKTCSPRELARRVRSLEQAFLARKNSRNLNNYRVGMIEVRAYVIQLYGVPKLIRTDLDILEIQPIEYEHAIVAVWRKSESGGDPFAINTGSRFSTAAGLVQILVTTWRRLMPAYAHWLALCPRVSVHVGAELIRQLGSPVRGLDSFTKLLDSAPPSAMGLRRAMGDVGDTDKDKRAVRILSAATDLMERGTLGGTLGSFWDILDPTLEATALKSSRFANGEQYINSIIRRYG